jgi:hypothetical protein
VAAGNGIRQLRTVRVGEHAKDGFAFVLLVPDEPGVEHRRRALPGEVDLPAHEVDAGGRMGCVEVFETAGAGPAPIHQERHVVDIEHIERVLEPAGLAVPPATLGERRVGDDGRRLRRGEIIEVPDLETRTAINEVRAVAEKTYFTNEVDHRAVTSGRLPNHPEIAQPIDLGM